MSSPSQLHVEETGTGTPVVLLHSSGLSGRQWRRLTANLVARGLRPVVPNLTGHGASAPWPEPRPFSFRQDVDAVVTLLRRGDAMHVVGHSYGALVGLLAAAEVPERLRSLALFEPVTFGVLDPIADADACRTLETVDSRWGPSMAERDRWLKMFVDYWGGVGAWEALREEARGEFRRVGWVVREGVRTLVEDRTPAAAYCVIRVPVTLLTGERSPLAARRVVERLGQTLPDSRVAVIAGAGHMAPLTHADSVNDVIGNALVTQ